MASPFFPQRHLAGALGVPFLQLADQGRQPRAGGVVLVDVATEAALQRGAVVPFQTGLFRVNPESAITS